jgi:uncharacterized protein (TIGR02757 family)
MCASSISRGEPGGGATSIGRPPGADRLEALYAEWNRRELVHPDPLEFVHRYADPRDREVVGLLAASLAYGRVAQILGSVEIVLGALGPSPAASAAGPGRARLEGALRGFRHRFTTGRDVCLLLNGAGRLIERCGSIERAFLSGMGPDDGTVVPALGRFAESLRDASGRPGGNLLPEPGKGSACKRLHLFLRWMVRRDEVDPGVWTTVSPALLVVPLDVHMHRIAVSLGATSRRQADLRTALQATEWFRGLSPGDPVKYDFALTRMGMRGLWPRHTNGEGRRC